MKKHYIIRHSILILSIFFTLSACNMDEYNPSGTTADAIWTTPDGIQTLINACYSEQREMFGKEDGIFMFESGTDLWINEKLGTYGQQLSRYVDLTPSTGNPNKAMWRILWTGLNLCNAGLERIGDIQFTADSIKNQKEAELHFLRAFYYWHIVETWGNVALVTSETKETILNQTRSTIPELYNLILSDLEFAAKYLPADQGKEWGRASKKAGYGMLARAYLSRAYYSTGTEASTYFTKAKDAASMVINNHTLYNVNLYQSFSDIFKPANNKGNTEALYTVCYASSENSTLNFDANANRLHMWYLSPYSTEPGMQISLDYDLDTKQRRLMPTLFSLDVFNDSIDSRYAATFQDVWLCNKSGYSWTSTDLLNRGKNQSLVGSTLKIGDTAIYTSKRRIPNNSSSKYTIADRDYMYNASTFKLNQPTVWYWPALKKFMDPITRATATTQQGYLDVVVMRLSEMYLIAAEADFQLGNNQNAADEINVLRTRAAIKTPIDYTSKMQVSASDISLDFILDERARELMGEHMRWFDLKRTRSLVQRIQKYNPDITLPSNLTTKGNGTFENVLLRPIPQSELDALLNGTEFGQNPGY